MISTFRIEAAADTPDDVMRFVQAARDRLGLGAGMGSLMFGAHELVIEGMEGGGYKGRAKFNFGPMNAVAQRMWFDGKAPFAEDREEYERLRAEANVEDARRIGDHGESPEPRVSDMLGIKLGEKAGQGTDTP
jgi:hypothetical protein